MAAALFCKDSPVSLVFDGDEIREAAKAIDAMAIIRAPANMARVDDLLVSGASTANPQKFIHLV